MSANSTVNEIRADAAATITKLQSESNATITALQAELTMIRDELTRMTASHVIELQELETRLLTESNITMEKIKTETQEEIRTSPRQQ